MMHHQHLQHHHSMRGKGSCSSKAVKMGTGLMGMCVIGYIAGPPLFWHLLDSLVEVRHTSNCPPCLCDCSAYPLISVPEGLNLSFTDCMKPEPSWRKKSGELVADELRMKEEEAQEKKRRADMTILEAKKMTSQYQKEADKCNSGMETCEEAREKAEMDLESQRWLTFIWESRARIRGWKDSSIR